MKRLSHWLPRLLTTITLVIGFLFMASVFTPDPSQADFSQVDSDLSQSNNPYMDSHSASPYTGMTSLGRIEGKIYNVEIFATPIGPRFSVWGTDGQELATLMTRKQVMRYFGEDLPLPDLQANSPLQLMHAEPLHADW